MLEAKQTTSAGATEIRLSGNIDEHSNLANAIGQPTGKVKMFCREVKRVNSVGVKGWMEFLQALKFRGADLEFHEVSPVMVEQLNMIGNFLLGSRVMSVCVPYSCGGCDNSFDEVYLTAALKQAKLQIGDRPCPKCKAAASFDDYPEQYLAFLKNP